MPSKAVKKVFLPAFLLLLVSWLVTNFIIGCAKVDKAEAKKSNLLIEQDLFAS